MILSPAHFVKSAIPLALSAAEKQGSDMGHPLPHLPPSTIGNMAHVLYEVCSHGRSDGAVAVQKFCEFFFSIYI